MRREADWRSMRPGFGVNGEIILPAGLGDEGLGALDQRELLDAEELAAVGRMVIGGVLGAIEAADIAGGEPVGMQSIRCAAAGY